MLAGHKLALLLGVEAAVEGIVLAKILVERDADGVDNKINS